MLKQRCTYDELKALLAEARYHLGRVLCEGEASFPEGERVFDLAVSELEEAIAGDPQNIGAYYYLGQAIRAQWERNRVKRARDVLRFYVSNGAPLGHEDELREFLESRKK
jgi:hypothetical protein